MAGAGAEWEWNCESWRTLRGNLRGRKPWAVAGGGCLPVATNARGTAYWCHLSALTTYSALRGQCYPVLSCPHRGTHIPDLIRPQCHQGNGW
jgi:hypothetical protein